MFRFRRALIRGDVNLRAFHVLHGRPDVDWQDRGGQRWVCRHSRGPEARSKEETHCNHENDGHGGLTRRGRAHQLGSANGYAVSASTRDPRSDEGSATKVARQWITTTTRSSDLQELAEKGGR